MRTISMRTLLTGLALASILTAGAHMPTQAADGDVEAMAVFELNFIAKDTKDCRVVTPSTEEIKVGKGTILFKAPKDTTCRFTERPSSDVNGPEPTFTKKGVPAKITFTAGGESFSAEYEFATEKECYKYSFLLTNALGTTPYEGRICSVR